jgi:hypothetical protein
MPMFSEDSFIRRHKIITALALVLILIVLWFLSLRRGPFHSYSLDIMIPKDGKALEAPGPLQVGVAVRDITANLAEYESWTDGNNNSKYDVVEDCLKGWQKPLLRAVNSKFKFYDMAKAAQSGDSYVEKNGNGRFDGCWIAGFSSNRPAKGIHDPQWARAVAVRNNGVTVVMVSVDAIGIFDSDIIAIRKMINPALKVDHLVLSSTHSHEVPDTMANWSGPLPLFNYDRRYMDKIKKLTKEAVEEAVASMSPADMYCATAKVPELGYVDDSRKPIIQDMNLYLWRFTKPNSDQTIATCINWGNHPEALGGDNSELTSDFCHYVREGLEKGVPEPNGVKGFGGTCVYFQGMIGGLATQLHTDVPKRDGSGLISDGTFEKAEHLGYNVAILAANALRGPEVWKNEKPFVAVAAKTINAKMTNPIFKYGIMLGLIHQGYYWGGYSRTETDAIRIGNVLIATTPGEIYPEIVVGGVEARPGRDFDIQPVEVPPIQSEAKKFAKQTPVFGLCNDEIGYMVPKSQWDTKAPWTYGNGDQYGEENSGGYEVAPAVHRGMLEMVRRVNTTFETSPAAPPVPVTPAAPAAAAPPPAVSTIPAISAAPPAAAQ